MGKGLRNYQGFTLIEILVSLSIFSIIALAVYASFAGGIGAWKKAQEFSSVYQTSRLLLQDMARELKNTVPITGIQFEGGPGKISFVTATQNPFSKLDAPITSHGLSRVSYELRRGRSYSQLGLYRRKNPDLKTPGEAQRIVDSIEKMEFHYTYKTEAGEMQPWSGVWEMTDQIPYGVKIDLTMSGSHFTKMIVIPHGYQDERVP